MKKVKLADTGLKFMPMNAASNVVLPQRLLLLSNLVQAVQKKKTASKRDYWHLYLCTVGQNDLVMIKRDLLGQRDVA
jgi:hypothetical protein